MNDIRETIKGFFSNRGSSIPGGTAEEIDACSYIDAGLVDSIGIVELIAHLEQAFGIQFTPEAMQSDEFRSIGGLVRLVDKQR